MQASRRNQAENDSFTILKDQVFQRVRTAELAYFSLAYSAGGRGMSRFQPIRVGGWLGTLDLQSESKTKDTPTIFWTELSKHYPACDEIQPCRCISAAQSGKAGVYKASA